MKTTSQPEFQQFHIEGVNHIAPQDAYDCLTNKSAVLIDIRENDEVDIDLIPLDNVLYHPMSVIMERLPLIDKNQNIIVMCPGGVRSTKVVNLLNIQGYPNVANLDGGFKLWKSLGLPFESILPSGEGCSGHCGSCGSGTDSSCC
jgi:rhodanese-related sulfurtransferase